MIAVLQRVTSAQVVVEGSVVGRIGRGLVGLVAVHATDAAEDVAWVAGKIARLRLFRQGDKHFDVDVTQAGGSVLLVSNFTVAAQTRQGRRPSFDAAATPAKGREMFDNLVEAVRGQGVVVETGEFGADMAVTLVNEGPATFIVDSTEGRGRATPPNGG